MSVHDAPTQRLARYVVSSSPDHVPDSIRHEAARSLVNWVGCALGGARHVAIERALDAVRPFSGPRNTAVIGRSERLDALHASLINGMSSHVLDFDDTHLRTLMHPSVPVASPLLALAESRALPGRDFVHALVLGVEVECRIANAIYATHNVKGYITGTAGVFGAAAAAGRVLGLDGRRMTQAFGIAATQAAGLREMAGTMCKSYVHGRAAQNGLTAALLAAAGFTSSERVLEAPRGFARVVAGDCDVRAMTADLGERFELALNTYKPYACGVVAHPVIDGCIALRDAHALDAGRIAAVRLRVHPLALTLTGIREPRSGLESKWSVYHSAAVALIDRAAGEHQYSEARVTDEAVRALRKSITAQADAGLGDDEAYVTLELHDGSVLEHHVDHAIGSVARPMSDSDLDQKFLALADGVLPASRAQTLLRACWAVETLEDAGELMRLAVSPR